MYKRSKNIVKYSSKVKSFLFFFLFLLIFCLFAFPFFPDIFILKQTKDLVPLIQAMTNHNIFSMDKSLYF